MPRACLCITSRALPARPPPPQVAQALSTRVDLLSPAYFVEIQRLQASVFWGESGQKGRVQRVVHVCARMCVCLRGHVHFRRVLAREGAH